MVSTPAPPAYRCFVGVDIAAASFTAIWSTDGRMQPRAVTFAQTPTGFAALHQQLHATGAAPAGTLVVLEATGSYWVALAVALHEAGYAVTVLNPAQLHSYAQSLPRRGKTDALDAQVFVRFAAERKPSPWTPEGCEKGIHGIASYAAHRNSRAARLSGLLRSSALQLSSWMSKRVSLGLAAL